MLLVVKCPHANIHIGGYSAWSDGILLFHIWQKVEMRGWPGSILFLSFTSDFSLRLLQKSFVLWCLVKVDLLQAICDFGPHKPALQFTLLRTRLDGFGCGDLRGIEQLGWGSCFCRLYCRYFRPFSSDCVDGCGEGGRGGGVLVRLIFTKHRSFNSKVLTNKPRFRNVLDRGGAAIWRNKLRDARQLQEYRASKQTTNVYRWETDGVRLVVFEIVHGDTTDLFHFDGCSFVLNADE